MEKLKRVRDFLQQQEKVFCVQEIKIDRTQNIHLLENSNFAEFYDFNICLRKGIPTKKVTSNKLQDFMDFCIDEIGIPFSKKEKFSGNSPIINQGYFCYDEKIGSLHLRKDYTFCFKDSSRNCFEQEQDWKEIDLNRRIIVKPFANKRIANGYRNTNYIGSINLERFYKKE